MNTHLLSKKTSIFEAINQRVLTADPGERILFSGFYQDLRKIVSPDRPADGEFYTWKPAGSSASAVINSTGDIIPAELESLAATLSLINETFSERPGSDLSSWTLKGALTGIVESDPAAQRTLELVNSTAFLREVSWRQQKAAAAVSLARWPHVNLNRVADGFIEERNALKDLPAALQKEAYVLLGENYLVNRGAAKDDNSVYGEHGNALRHILQHFLPFVNDSRINPTLLFDATFADLPSAFKPGQFWLERVEGGHGKTLTEQVQVLDDFINAYASGDILSWISSGFNREGKRKRAVLLTATWREVSEPGFINQVTVDPITEMPSNGGIEMLGYIYTSLIRGVPADELAPAFKLAEQWVRVLPTAGVYQAAAVKALIKTRSM